MSCLFVALARQLGMDPRLVRKDICAYLEAGGTVIDGMQTKELVNSQYVREMSRPSTWGSAIEIQAACNLYRIRVAVTSLRPKDSRKPIVFTPVAHRLWQRTLFMTWTGSHYEASPPRLLT